MISSKNKKDLPNQSKEEKEQRNIPRRIQTILIIFFVWLIISLLYYFVFIKNWATTKTSLDHIDSGFAVSFSASLMDDLIMFLLLTPLVIYLTTKPLWDYSFSEKVNALINSKHAKNRDSLTTYVHKSISSLMAYNKQIFFKISVRDYDATTHAYSLYIETKIKASNMCRDKDFVLNKDYSFYVMPSDVIPGKEAGFVTSLIKTNIEEKNGITTYIDSNNIFKLDRKFEQKINFVIAKNGEIEISLKYNTWSITGDKLDLNDLSIWNFLQIDRYSNDVNVLVRNDLNRALKFDVYVAKHQNDDEKTVTLDHNMVLSAGQEDSHKVTRELLPKEDVRIFFHKP
ncbi:MAG: hypothetical protein NTW29_01650 [Bacteroidetes bacterium]|nr:hypothetical protein [Bacteroidota bacterium]